jgi:hypothetical protein
MNIPMPLRVPELAPSLGRVIVARRREAPWVPLDDIREELATAVLELAGDGRGAAAREERDQVLEITGRRAWAAAWDRAVRRAAARVADALDDEIARTARQVRLPRRRLRRRLLASTEKRAIAARLGTGGAAFVAALDELDAAAARVQGATVLDKDAHGAWQDALRTAARRVEAAWLTLESEGEAEHRRWTPEIETLARWRPSLWPVALLWVPIATALIWLGLVLGGYLPAPAWLASRLGF